LIVVDNAFAFGQLFWDRATDREAPDVKAFNELMAREPRVQAVIVPIGDGLWVGVKRWSGALARGSRNSDSVSSAHQTSRMPFDMFTKPLLMQKLGLGSRYQTW
jgi:hypothetical protein